MLSPTLFVLLFSATTPAETPEPRPAPIEAPKQITKAVSGLTIQVDLTYARPGGVVVAKVKPRKPIGPASFALEGRKAPVYPSPWGLRALVPVPLTVVPGHATLGLEILGRRGRRRIPIEITIDGAAFSPRTLAVPEAKLGLLEKPERVRDSRRVLEAVRTETAATYAKGTLRAPIIGEPDVFFGGLDTYAGSSFVTLLMDGLYGDHHRGLDYPAPPGTPVRAPGAGVVRLAQDLAISGQTVVIDHGRGVLSAFFHLSRIDVTPNQALEAGVIVGASGESGVATRPHLHWGVYLHGAAVDPRVLETLDLG